MIVNRQARRFALPATTWFGPASAMGAGIVFAHIDDARILGFDSFTIGDGQLKTERCPVGITFRGQEDRLRRIGIGKLNCRAGSLRPFVRSRILFDPS